MGENVKDIVQALVIVLALNVLLFLAQTAMTDLNPGGVQIFNFDESYLDQFNNGNFTLDEDVSNDLPSSANTVAVDVGGNFFTDTFATIRDWLVDTIPGVRLLLNVVNAVPNFLKSFGMPAELSFALGVMWHAIVFIFVLIFIKD